MTWKGLDPEQAAKALRKFPQTLALEMRKSLERGGQAWHRKMLRRFRGEPAVFPNVSRYKHLTTRSGRLRRSLRVNMSPKGGTKVWMKLVSRGTPYAAAQEFGDVIRAKSAKWLWIPMKDNTTPGGVTRKSPRALMQDRDNLYFHKVKGKDAMIVYLTHTWRGRGGKGRRSGGSGHDRQRNRKMKAMFYLKKSTVIPGPKSTGTKSRFGFFDSWEALAKRRRAEFDAGMYRAAIAALKQGKRSA